MRPTALVLTTVHWPDDTRIRERLIRTLSSGFRVVYAARSPGPSDTGGLDYLELSGGRWRRNLGAIRVALTSRWDVMVVHDPELIVCAVLARVIRRRPVVFDVHEDVPASAYTRAWVPRWARPFLSALMKGVLRAMEPILTITLAEAGYQRRFRRNHPVFANYPDTSGYPEARGDVGAPVVYVGDVTLERGADLAVAACSEMELPLRLVGRITPETRDRLRKESSLGDALTFDGLVPNPEAVAIMASSSVALSPLRDLPNYRHSQPTKVLEYLAVGIPVVASDLPGTRELVDGLDAVFLCEPGVSRSLAEAVSKARTQEAVESARAQAPEVRARFQWPSEEVRAFYRSLL